MIRSNSKHRIDSLAAIAIKDKQKAKKINTDISKMIPLKISKSTTMFFHTQEKLEAFEAKMENGRYLQPKRW